MSDKIGFIVEYVVTDSATYYHLIGRCCDTPIHVGDTFDVAYAPSKPTGREYAGLGTAGPVMLRVERIESYQRQLKKLGQGMTGTIDVRGEGLDRIEPGAVLGLPIHGPTDADVESLGTDSPAESRVK